MDIVSDRACWEMLVRSPLDFAHTSHRPHDDSHGVLNGWTGLRTLQVMSVTSRHEAVLLSMKTGIGQIVRNWDAEKDKTKPSLPEIKDGEESETRVTLLAPPWSSLGWGEKNPGFVYWYCGQRQDTPPVLLFVGISQRGLKLT